MNTSFFYEVLLYLNLYYFGMFALCEISMIVIKYIHIPYPTGSLISEIALLTFLCFLESVRIFLGRKGNLSERALPVIVSSALIVPSALAVTYFLLWQTYILRLEVILCVIQLILLASEFVFASLCFLPNKRPNIM